MKNNELIYQLHDTPPHSQTLLAAGQHILASFVGLITPTLIIGSVLGLHEQISYLISMALVVNGVATFIQARPIGPVGSGLIVLQGTSFAFLGAVLSAGLIVKNRGGGPDEILAIIFGICFVGSFIKIALSQILDKIKRIISPVVTGCVITLIGLSLIEVGIDYLAGGKGAEDYGSLNNILLGASVFALIILLNSMRNEVLRSAALMIGLIVGSFCAFAFGLDSFEWTAPEDVVAIPIPFKYGFSFDWAAFIPIALIYVLSVIEMTGDLTATNMVSGQPVKGDQYFKRIKGGVLAGGVNAGLAAVFNSFPNSSFSQNNGVIVFTGNASNKVGMAVGGLLVLLGLFPALGAVLQEIPKPVLGGATLLLFGTVAVAGISILSSIDMNRRNSLIVAASLSIGLGTAMVPEVFESLPDMIESVFGSAVSAGGVTAIVLTLLIPEVVSEDEVDGG